VFDHLAIDMNAYFCQLSRMIRTDDVAPTTGRTPAEFRRPSQKRSRERFEAILDAAERLLETLDPAAVSIHRLAGEIGIPAASIYHFFPEPPLVFAALAERYLNQFEERAADEAPIVFDTWQELQTHRFGTARDFFNANAPARKVLLDGPALSFDIRMRDLQSDVVTATRGVEEMNRLFILPDIPHLIERSIEVIVLSDAMWSLSIHRHGTITDEMEEQARRARIAYARTYLPEYLPKRPVAAPARP
jgi:AcrR family transcriptional regulator